MEAHRYKTDHNSKMASREFRYDIYLQLRKRSSAWNTWTRIVRLESPSHAWHRRQHVVACLGPSCLALSLFVWWFGSNATGMYHLRLS